MLIIAMLSFVTAFIISYILTRYWIDVAKKVGIVGKDMNKKGEVMVPEAGGIGFVMGTTIGILLFIAYLTFIVKSYTENVSLLAVVSTTLLAGFIGILDDLGGWKKGLPPYIKVLFTFAPAIPLMAINAGFSTMEIPFIGKIRLGVLYPLLAVPIGVVGATNAVNMIAGLNGLEAGMVSIILFTLGVVAFTHHLNVPLTLSASGLGAALGFLYWNRYPAKVFPGDVFTYSAGAFIASIAIVGNMEKVALFLFIPYFIELMLFLRGLKDGVYKESWGIPTDKGIKPPYEKVYSITHLAMKIQIKLRGYATERDTVLLILGFEGALAILAIILWG